MGPGALVHSSPTSERVGAHLGTAAPPGALEVASCVPLPSLTPRYPTSNNLFPAGGLATVIYTDALQTVIMVVGAVILAVKGKGWALGLQRGGCPSGLQD